MAARKVLLLSVSAAVALTALIFAMSPLLEPFRAILLPDAGPAWYFWKLPAPGLWATVSMWVLYGLHQITVWVLIRRLQQQQKPLHPGGVGKYNVALLAVNGAFILLHMVQTALFYDGLAQYVPVFSSQGSVIVMLVFMLILAAGQRGLFFGKKIHLPKEGLQFIRRNHGYYIAWALVYTFWFHPVESTWGHVLGFFYMYLLMIQMSMAYTPVHVNLKWITALELIVGLHGATVALQGGSTIWSMFAFGFLMMFVVTAQYGVIRAKWLKIAFTALYFASALAVYANIFGTGQNLVMIHQITWIPAILYGLVFVFAWAAQGIALLLGGKPNKAAKTA